MHCQRSTVHAQSKPMVVVERFRRKQETILISSVFFVNILDKVRSKGLLEAGSSSLHLAKCEAINVLI